MVHFPSKFAAEQNKLKNTPINGRLPVNISAISPLRNNRLFISPDFKTVKDELSKITEQEQSVKRDVLMELTN